MTTLEATQSPDRVDAVTVAVISNELSSIAEEMAVAMLRTGRSAMMKAGDFATGICDRAGRVTGQGLGTGFAFSVFHYLVPAVLEKVGEDWKPGDVVITNDHYGGGMTHMPDLGVIAPVFVDGGLEGFAVSYSHHSDIGGRFPGGVSGESSSTYEEGLRIPIVKLYDAGAPNEALLEMVRANIRVPEQWIGDLMAKVVGCRTGAERLEKLLAENGAETFQRACDQLVEGSERAVRAWIAGLPDGEYHEEEVVESDLIRPGGRVEIKLRLVVEGERILADFGGTSGQLETAINVPIGSTAGALHAAIRSMANLDVAANSGYFAPLEVAAPEGSVVNPIFPAPVGGRAGMLLRVLETVNRALSQVVKERAAVPAVGGDGLHYSGLPGAETDFSFFDLVFGGWGARATKDGIDGIVPPFMGSLGSLPAEVIEQQYPIVIEGFGFVPDTAGAGRYRGSLAVFKHWRFLEPGKVMARMTRPTAVPGLEGGKAGPPVSTQFVPAAGEPQDISGRLYTHLSVGPGDRLLHSTSATGGFGDPLTREPGLVRADVVAEKLSVEQAREQYGVVLDAADLSVDEEQTATLRSSRSGGPEEATG